MRGSNGPLAWLRAYLAALGTVWVVFAAAFAFAAVAGFLIIVILHVVGRFQG